MRIKQTAKASAIIIAMASIPLKSEASNAIGIDVGSGFYGLYGKLMIPDTKTGIRLGYASNLETKRDNNNNSDPLWNHERNRSGDYEVTTSITGGMVFQVEDRFEPWLGIEYATFDYYEAWNLTSDYSNSTGSYYKTRNKKNIIAPALGFTAILTPGFEFGLGFFGATKSTSASIGVTF